VELDVKTDPQLLGGFVVQIGSEIWDASVAGKINKFRESLA
jgi:F0F1-type ATP synthase delta subunit